ncbi:hypothetical protein GF337_02815 [candidate division KSB1 bacterium]|nr:hypothetical protein [candidate division KSB1 bacterium]
MILNILLITSTRIGSPWLGIIIPAIIFTFSFIVTYLLIRHFMKKQ